jgi:putative ABC transport system substrate-binding protein
MVTRRKIVLLLGVGAIAPLSASPNQTASDHRDFDCRIRQSQGHNLSAFKRGWQILGWKEGTEFILENPLCEGHYDRLPTCQRNCEQEPGVIVAAPSQAVAAISKAAPKSPIVAASGDPLGAGLVSNLARPGGYDHRRDQRCYAGEPKHLQLFARCGSGLKRVGFLSDPSNPSNAVMFGGARRQPHSTVRHDSRCG